jgi:hypothetical protein
MCENVREKMKGMRRHIKIPYEKGLIKTVRELIWGQV